MGITKRSNKAALAPPVPGPTVATTVTHPSTGPGSNHATGHQAHHLPLAGKHYGSLGHPSGILLATGAEEAGGAGGAITAALNTSGSRASHVGDVVVSLILIVIIFFVSAMASFFWKKYKTIHTRSASYEYSQLSQSERDSSDLTEVADDYGLSMGTSTDEEELEPASPATIPVTSSYLTPKSTPAAQVNDILINNNNQSEAKSVDILSSVNNAFNANSGSNFDGDSLSSADLLPAAMTPVRLSPVPAVTAVPLLPQMPPPLQTMQKSEIVPPNEAQAHARSLFNDSDEELLQ